MCSAEVDLWEDPKHLHWMAIILHMLDKSFDPKSFILYVGRIADKSAHEQAQRILHVCNRYGIDASHLLWVIGVDNTGSAYKVPEHLGMQCLRCGAHVIALGPKHLFYNVRRMQEGAEVMTMHERADPECFESVDHIRRIHKKLRSNEKVRLQFEQVQKSRGRVKPLTASQDSEAKWIGLTGFLQRHWELRHDIQELHLRHPDFLQDVGGPLSAAELIISRDLQGSMKPWEHTTAIMQSNTPRFRVHQLICLH